MNLEPLHDGAVLALLAVYVLGEAPKLRADLHRGLALLRALAERSGIPVPPEPHPEPEGGPLPMFLRRIFRLAIALAIVLPLLATSACAAGRAATGGTVETVRSTGCAIFESIDGIGHAICGVPAPAPAPAPMAYVLVPARRAPAPPAVFEPPPVLEPAFSFSPPACCEPGGACAIPVR